MAICSTDPAFQSALGRGAGPMEALADVLAQLDERLGEATLGFVFLSDSLAGSAGRVVASLAEQTGLTTWIGTSGMGVSATEAESFGKPAIAVLTVRLPPNAFCPMALPDGDTDTLPQPVRSWLAEHTPGAGLVFADPRNPNLSDAIEALAEHAGGFLIGGLSATDGACRHICRTGVGEDLLDGGLCGVLLDQSVPLVTGVSQGCAPIGPVHEITRGDDTIIKEIDGRPALDVFKDEIGPDLAQDLHQVGGVIFVAFPIPGLDTGDYTVRSLIGIDPAQGWIAVGDLVQTGQRVLFARRDRASAESDLRQMVRKLRRRLPEPARGGLYISCVARGPHLFGAEGTELGIIRDELGALPLAGFFANGEISRSQIYSYTGVLTLFP